MMESVTVDSVLGLPDDIVEYIVHLVDDCTLRAVCRQMRDTSLPLVHMRLGRLLASRYVRQYCVVDNCDDPCFTNMTHFHSVDCGRVSTCSIPTLPYCKLHCCVHVISLSHGEMLMGSDAVSDDGAEPSAMVCVVCM